MIDTVLTSTERTTAVANLADSLRMRIILCEFNDGQAITELEIAKMYSVSRGTVRTALQMLEAEGVIGALPNGRKIILGITEAYIRDLYHTRMLIECEAARQILSMSTIDFAELAAIASSFQEVEGLPIEDLRTERARLNMSFHRTIISMSRNRPLLRCWGTMDQMIYALSQFNSNFLKRETHRDTYVSNHLKILQMLIGRDADVVKFLEGHTNREPCSETLAGLSALREERVRKARPRRSKNGKNC